jgi:hypothetical protein
MNKRIQKTIIPLVFSICAAAGAYGCAGAYSPKEKLLKSTTSYYEAFRWKKVQNMKEHIPDEMQSAFGNEFSAKYKDIKIVDYEIVEIKLGQSKKTASVIYSFAWHPIDETIIREAVIEDTWESKGSKWLRVGQKVIEGELP